MAKERGTTSWATKPVVKKVAKVPGQDWLKAATSPLAQINAPVKPNPMLPSGLGPQPAKLDAWARNYPNPAQQYMADIYGPTYSPAQSQGMWNTMGPTQTGPTQPTFDLSQTPAGQGGFLNPNGTINTAGAMPLKNVLLAPELQFLDKSKLTDDAATQKFAQSYTDAYANMLFQDNPLPEPGAVNYGGYTGGGGYGYGGGGGADYSKAPYAWMSKLLNWNVNKG